MTELETWRIVFLLLALLSFIVGCIASAWSLSRDRKMIKSIKAFTNEYKTHLTFDGKKATNEKDPNVVNDVLKKIQFHLERKFYSAIACVALIVILLVIPLLIGLWKERSNALGWVSKQYEKWPWPVGIGYVIALVAFLVYLAYFSTSYNLIKDNLKNVDPMKSFYDRLKNKQPASDIIDDKNRQSLIDIIDQFEKQHTASKPAGYSFLACLIFLLVSFGPEIIELIIYCLAGLAKLFSS